MSNKEVYNTILRTLNGKKGTGRKRSKKEISAILQDYRKRTAVVEPNLDWEDYLNLIDIGTHINVNNAVDLAFRIGYVAGNTSGNKTSDREYELVEIIDETEVDLSKAIIALEEFVNEYDWAVTPTADKANKYGSTIGGHGCSLDEEISWKLLAEYDKIKWLIQIAHDYCWSASKALQKKDK